MVVASLFDSALRTVLKEVAQYERDFLYLPGDLRLRLAHVLARRGLLHSKNMPLVLHEALLALDLSECALSVDELCILWRCCPKLRKVDLGLRRGHRDTLPAQALSQFFSHSPRLHTLNLQGCSLLDDASLSMLASSCPLLSSLTLSSCPLVSDRGVATIAVKCRHLQALGLARTKVSSEGLTALSGGPCAKVIKELDISHCLSVTDAGISSLLSHCPLLSILVFHGCPLLTSHSRTMASRAHLKQLTWTIY